MKKILILIFCFFFGQPLIHAQKNIHDANAVVRNLSGFHGIQIQDGIDLYLTQSDKEAVAVSASSSEYRDKINTEVENGILKISYGDKSHWGVNWGNHKLKAYVSVKTIDRLHASGGADVYIEDKLRATQLYIQLSGGSDLSGALIVDELALDASGGSDAKISGSAKKATIGISGGSDFKGYDFKIENCSINASGGSDANIYVDKELNSHASGGSDIYYKGNAITKSSSSGDGSIKKRD